MDSSVERLIITVRERIIAIIVALSSLVLVSGCLGSGILAHSSTTLHFKAAEWELVKRSHAPYVLFDVNELDRVAESRSERASSPLEPSAGVNGGARLSEADGERPATSRASASGEVRDARVVRGLILANVLSGYLDWPYAQTPPSSLTVRGVTIDGPFFFLEDLRTNVVFVECVFRGPVALRGVSTNGRVSFESCIFSAPVELSGVTTPLDLSFNNSHFAGGLSLFRCTAERLLDLQNCSFSGPLFVGGCKSPSGLNARGVQLRAEERSNSLRVIDCEFDSMALDVHFRGPYSSLLEISGSTIHRFVEVVSTFNDEAVRSDLILDGLRGEGDLLVIGGEFDETLIGRVSMSDGVSLENVESRSMIIAGCRGSGGLTVRRCSATEGLRVSDIETKALSVMHSVFPGGLALWDADVAEIRLEDLELGWLDFTDVIVSGEASLASLDLLGGRSESEFVGRSGSMSLSGHFGKLYVAESDMRALKMQYGSSHESAIHSSRIHSIESVRWDSTGSVLCRDLEGLKSLDLGQFTSPGDLQIGYTALARIDLRGANITGACEFADLRIDEQVSLSGSSLASLRLGTVDLGPACSVNLDGLSFGRVQSTTGKVGPAYESIRNLMERADYSKSAYASLVTCLDSLGEKQRAAETYQAGQKRRWQHIPVWSWILRNGVGYGRAPFRVLWWYVGFILLGVALFSPARMRPTSTDLGAQSSAYHRFWFAVDTMSPVPLGLVKKWEPKNAVVHALWQSLKVLGWACTALFGSALFVFLR